MRASDRAVASKKRIQVSRDRDRDGERDKQTDRQAGRQTETETDREGHWLKF